MSIKLPKLFQQRYKPIVDNFPLFCNYLEKPSDKSFRINKIKAGKRDVIGNLEKIGIRCNTVSWYRDAYTTDSDMINNTIERFVGSIYFQELASMLPPLLIQKELQGESLHVLDACAAPGSKATQVASFMNNTGTLVANDSSYSRIRGLKFNLNHAGATNAIITHCDLNRFKSDPFDIILLDPPCSSEGTIRKNPYLLKRWHKNIYNGHASVQKGLILKAFDLLRPNGILIYSTCTFAPEENEIIIDYLLNRREASLESFSLPDFIFSPPLTEWKGTTFHNEVKKARRVWPHHNNTDGFFVARIRK